MRSFRPESLLFIFGAFAILYAVAKLIQHLFNYRIFRTRPFAEDLRTSEEVRYGPWVAFTVIVVMMLVLLSLAWWKLRAP